jgi:hypothetical protein
VLRWALLGDVGRYGATQALAGWLVHRLVRTSASMWCSTIASDVGIRVPAPADSYRDRFGAMRSEILSLSTI